MAEVSILEDLWVTFGITVMSFLTLTNGKRKEILSHDSVESVHAQLTP